MNLILCVLVVSAILLLSELGWRKHWLNNEFGRKFVHVTVGTFVAFWPQWLTWGQIRFVSVAFLLVVIISNYFKLFRAIHSVQRPTYGEAFFAVSVGLLTVITHSKAVYAAAILQMSLADGFAAIFGTRFGRDNKYHLLGHNKSVVGTLAFIVTSFAILVGYGMLGVGHVPWGVVAFGSLSAALLENIAPLGLDNILVPVFIAFLLGSM